MANQTKTVHAQRDMTTTQCGQQWLGSGYRVLLRTLPGTLRGSTGGITCKACVRRMESNMKW